MNQTTQIFNVASFGNGLDLLIILGLLSLIIILIVLILWLQFDGGATQRI